MSSVLCATAESRISNEYTAPLWTSARSTSPRCIASSSHHASSMHHPSNSFSCFCCCFILGIRGHLRCIGNFCSRPCYFLFLFAQHVPLFFFDTSHNPSCSLAHALFILRMLSLIPRPLHLPSFTYSTYLKILHVNFFIFLIPSFFSSLFVHYFLFLVDATSTLISPYA